MRRILVSVIAACMIAGVLLVPATSGIGGYVDGEFPDRIITLTKDSPSKAPKATVSMPVVSDTIGEWWVSVDSIDGNSIITANFWQLYLGYDELLSSSKMTEAGQESEHMSIAPGVSYNAILTLTGAPGTCQLSEHFVPATVTLEPAWWNCSLDARDVQFDPARPYVYFSDVWNHSVSFTNLLTGEIEKVFEFSLTPESLAMSPDASTLYVALLTRPHDPSWSDEEGHIGYIACFDLDSKTMISQYEINEDPYDLVITSNGHLVVSSGSGQWTYIRVYDASSGEELANCFPIRHMSNLALHPSQSIVYAADTDLSPSDITRFDLEPDGTITRVGDSPYHGEYDIDGNLWMSPVGDVFVTLGGDVFTAGRAFEEDMVYVTSMASNRIYGGAVFDVDNDAILTGESYRINIYNMSTYQMAGYETMPAWVYRMAVYGDMLAVVLKTGSLTIVVVMENPAAEQAENDPPVASFTVTPNSGTTDTIFSVDASSCWDYEDPIWALEVRWDWESNGVWDTSWSTSKLGLHSYPFPGTYAITLEVRDTNWATDQTNRSVTVFTEPPEYLPHAPILIIGDENFTAENGVVNGSGTANDPFLITGWEIFANDTNGIEVKYTSAHFVIKDVIVTSAATVEPPVGIFVFDAENVRIEDCLVMYTLMGILVGCCENVVIVRNACFFNTDSGIFVELCWNTYIADNYVSMSLNGIFNNDSMYTHIFRNYVNNNSRGISVTVYSLNVTVEENNVELNGVGIRVQYEYWPMPMENVLIFHNRIVDNAVQATDNNLLETVWDNGYPSGGNYWSDYYGNDTDGDGIGDTPYVISDDVVDRYPLMAPWSSSEPPEPGVVCVSNGTSVTIFEATGEVYAYTFSVSELMTTGGAFSTVAMLSETYTITSDGVFLVIECNRIPPYPCEGTATGNNIVAVRLDGVPGFEDGLWATVIVNYTIGTGGIEDSRWNALGPVDQIGPYGDSSTTYLGDYYSAIVLGFTVP